MSGYEGEVMDACGLIALDFGKLAVVAVSGSGPNVCGHLILFSEANGGYYFHVAGVYQYPRYMDEPGYRRYLQENGKTEIVRRYVALPNPEGASAYVEKTLSQPWFWKVLPNNCVVFCENVIEAGGGTWSSKSNCPTLATKKIETLDVRHFLYRFNAEIYRQYGVPR